MRTEIVTCDRCGKKCGDRDVVHGVRLVFSTGNDEEGLVKGVPEVQGIWPELCDRCYKAALKHVKAFTDKYAKKGGTDGAEA